MWRGISLANKTLLVFGGAIVVVVLAALTVPFFRMTFLVDQGQLELCGEMLKVWERAAPRGPAEFSPDPVERVGISARRMSVKQAQALAPGDAFLREALDTFTADSTREEVHSSRWVGTNREYRYATPIRSKGGAPALSGLLILERRPYEATRMLLLNSAFLFTAGGVVLMASLVAFYFLTHKVFLQPVRSLKETAERVREGNLSIRSDISTGDEFEELSSTFNSMLGDLQSAQDQQRAINRALDLKLNELAQSNLALHEGAKLKGEFLANVSHELRTPLNSIIGFAELLLEIAKHDAAASPEPPLSTQKRLRYNENILTAARSLLALINSLLEMAKIEAGKVELAIAPMDLRESCEGLLGLISPLADKKGIQLKLELPDAAPVVRTDARKFQQIVFNFLSNAVKFTEPQERTGRPALVTLRAERLPAPEAGHERVRVSVIDNGPGIPPEEHARVFEKFHQLDNSATREHTGTGLGLAISKELAHVLHGELQLVSDVGKGSMFSVILPLDFHAPDGAAAGSARPALITA